MSKVLTLKPRLSEKAYALSQERNVYVFDIAAGTSKQLIAQAVTSQYEVTVTTVRVAATASKTKRAYRRGTRASTTGERSAIRKAYVTLKDGDSLPFFASEEPAKKDKK